MAEYKNSSTTGLKRCISSMKSTSPFSKLVNKPAKSPAFSNTGPLVVFIFAPNSLAIMILNVVFPKPGGPCKST